MKRLRDGESCNVKFEEAEITAIDGIKNSIVKLEDCNIDALKISNCENCEFLIIGGKTSASGFISNNKQCVFGLIDVTFDVGDSILNNEDCTVWCNNSKCGSRILLKNNNKLVFEGNDTIITAKTATAQAEQTLYLLMKGGGINGGKDDAGIEARADSCLIFVETANTVGNFFSRYEESSASFLDSSIQAEQKIGTFWHSSLSLVRGSVDSQGENLVGDYSFLHMTETQMKSQIENVKLFEGGIKMKASSLQSSSAPNVSSPDMLFFESYESELTSPAGSNVQYGKMHSVQIRQSKMSSSGRNMSGSETYVTRIYRGDFSNGLSGIHYTGQTSAPELPLYVEVENRNLQLNNQYGQYRPAPPPVPEGQQPPEQTQPSGPTPGDCAAFKAAVTKLGFKWEDDKVNVIGVSKGYNTNHAQQTYDDEIVLCGPGVFKKFPASLDPGVVGKARLTTGQQLQYYKGLHQGKHPCLKQGTPARVTQNGVTTQGTTIRGFNIHAGGNPSRPVGDWSHGCQVLAAGGWNGAMYKEFLQLTYYRAGQEKFWYTKLESSDLA